LYNLGFYGQSFGMNQLELLHRVSDTIGDNDQNLPVSDLHVAVMDSNDQHSEETRSHGPRHPFLQLAYKYYCDTSSPRYHFERRQSLDSHIAICTDSKRRSHSERVRTGQSNSRAMEAGEEWRQWLDHPVPVPR